MGEEPNTGDVLSLIPTTVALTDTIMLDVHLPATHTQGVLPASMPPIPIATDMTDASAPMLTRDTALVATSHPELVLPMDAGTCHAPAASDACMTTAVTAKPTTPASAAPRPHYVDIPKTNTYALPLDVSAIELGGPDGVLSYRTRWCGLNVLKRLQSAVAFAQALRMIRTKSERSANSRNYNLRAHTICRASGTLAQCCPQRRKHSYIRRRISVSNHFIMCGYRQGLKAHLFMCSVLYWKLSTAAVLQASC